MKKECAVCKTPKELSEFYYYRSTDNYSRLCKPCERAKSREYHKNHREKQLRRNRKWYAENTDRKDEYTRQYKARRSNT